MTPEGLNLVPNFISDEEETELLASIDKAPWQTDLQRRVQHYGWRYDYSARRVDPSAYIGSLPKWMSPIVDRIDRLGHFPRRPQQAIVNEYVPGQGIAPHVDCIPCFGPVIASLSMSGDCEMQFDKGKSGPKVALHLPRKSFLILTGPARYDWRHAIQARKSDPAPLNKGRIQRERRISLTFRTLA